MLGLGLLLYSFGEWDLPGLVWTSPCLSWADRCLLIFFRQPLLLWCPVCPLWSPAMVRVLPQRLLRVGEGQLASDSLLPSGSPGQKGTIMGILRSLGALGRALGPMVAASGKYCRIAPQACCVPLATTPSCLHCSILAAEGNRGRDRAMKSLGEHLSLHSVLAGWSPGLLHCVRWTLFTPLLSPAEPEASSTDFQGGVAELPHSGCQVETWARTILAHSFLQVQEGLPYPHTPLYGIPAGSLGSYTLFSYSKAF